LGFEDKLRGIKELNKVEERIEINTKKLNKDRENQKRMN